MGTHLSSRFRIVGRLVFAAVLISMILLFSAGNARATAIGSSNAWINWDTLTITGIRITFTDRFSESDYSVVDNGTLYEDFDDVTDWSSTYASVTTTNAEATSFTSDDAALSNRWLGSQAFASVSGYPSFAYVDYTGAFRGGEFTADADGTLVISVAYDLEVDVSTDAGNEWADAETDAFVYLENTTEWTEDFATDYGSVFLALGGDSYYHYEEGWLTVSLYFADGEAGFMELGVDSDAYAAAVVPEPTTIALLGIGLAGLGGVAVRRRLRKNKP